MARSTTTTPRKSTTSTRSKSSARPAPKATPTAVASKKTQSSTSKVASKETSTKPDTVVASTASKGVEATSEWTETQDSSELRKKELVDLVVERSGIKKRDAKPAIETALSILGEALAEGQSLNLPPMGKIKVQRSKDVDGAEVLSLRMRRKTQTGEKTEVSPLAEPAE